MYKDLTPEQKEIIDLTKAGRNDPVLFSKELLGIELHDGQKLWLWMTTGTCRDKVFKLGLKLEKWNDRAEFDGLLKKNKDFGKNILVPSNRWGKTLVTTVKHLWYNYYKKGVRGTPKNIAEVRCGTLNLSPHSNQCQAGYQYIIDILEGRLVYMINKESFKNNCKIGDFLVRANSQKRQIIFKNGTNYRAVPTGEDQASSLAGTPYLYISYDECAQSLHLKQEIPAKIMSRLIDFGGPLDLVSTPEVDRPSHQYFYHIAKKGLKGEDGFWTLLGKITDNFFLGSVERDKIAESIRTTDPAKYRQVMYGEFVTTGAKMFDSIIIERLWDRVDPEGVLMNNKYIVIADWGFADTGDPTVFYIIDYTDFPRYRICFVESIKGGSPFAILTRAKILQREWNGGIFLHDASSMGGVIIKKMLREMEMGEIIDFNGSGGNKVEMLFSLIVVMSEGRKAEADKEGKVTELNPNFGRLRSYHIPELEEQMGNYQYNPAKGVSDKKLEQDHVMALGMGIWYLEKKLNKSKPKAIKFNPLATKISSLFDEKGAKQIKVKVSMLPEKRIM